VGDPVKDEVGIPYVVDGLGELGRGLEERVVLNSFHAPNAQAGFPGLVSTHKIELGWPLGMGGGRGDWLRVRWCGKLIGGTWAAGMCGGRGPGPAVCGMGNPCVMEGVGCGGTGCGVTSKARRSPDGRGEVGDGEMLQAQVAGRGP